ncbi:MAG: ABC transporter substrate-binding protein [bacterium]
MVSKANGPRSVHRRANRTAAIGLALVMMLAGAATMFAAGQQEQEGSQDAPQAADVEAANEAPQLADMVEQGDLPPLDQRLPEQPLVIEPHEEIGRYGGTMRSGLVGGDDLAWLLRTVGYDWLVRWAPDWSGVIPNVARDFTISNDVRVYTFFLREGMRWSDGEPFTADDVVFWYEDVVKNEDLSAGYPAWMMAGGELAELEKVDDYTFRVTFAEPSGLFLQYLATPSGEDMTNHPRHYLEQFHADYNPDIDELIEAEDDVETWDELFDIYNDQYGNPERPTLKAWRLATPYGGETTRVTLERNPYYWKVDTEGNQLPYIDGWVFDVFQDNEVLLLRTLGGEIDIMDRHITTTDNRPVLFENMDRGDYWFSARPFSHNNEMNIGLNLTHDDPVKREVFQNREFRVALSHAIDRDEMNDLLYAGSTEGWQPAPPSQAPFYHERLATQYLEYDPALANEILDDAGFSSRDNAEFRLGPDGNRITITVEVSAATPSWIDALELVQGYWAEIGIDMQIRSMDRTLFYERKAANQHDAGVWFGGGGIDGNLDPRWYFPYSAESLYAPRWAAYYNQASLPDLDPEEPPAETRRQMELYETLLTSPPEEHNEIMLEILDIAADMYYAIGTHLRPPGYAVFSNRLRNVSEEMPGSWQFPNPGPDRLEQYFLVD